MERRRKKSICCNASGHALGFSNPAGEGQVAGASTMLATKKLGRPPHASSVHTRLDQFHCIYIFDLVHSYT